MTLDIFVAYLTLPLQVELSLSLSEYERKSRQNTLLGWLKVCFKRSVAKKLDTVG